MSRGRVRFSRRVRRNAVALIALTIALLFVLLCAYLIARNGSDEARRITLICWGALSGASYLAYIAYAIWEYFNNRIDVAKVQARKQRFNRRLILKEAKRICREEGRKLTPQERRDIKDGKYDATGFKRSI